MPRYNKVLVVDNEPHILRLVQVNLERAGCEVIATRDGEDALRQAEAERPDLIMVGTPAPPMKASELLQRLRENPATKDIPVKPIGERRRRQ